MTTTDVARELGVTGEYVRGEILAGRLEARINRRGKRAVYRITPSQLAAYIAQHWRPDVPHRTNTQPSQRNQ